MSLPNFKKEREVFEECLSLTGGEREEYLRKLGAESPQLELRIRRLLDAHHQAESSLSPLERAPLPEHPRQIGPYQLRKVIGEGGMGVVYEAEQQEPVQRTVALKLVKLGMDDPEVLSRFETERQALAFMNHPHIARVYEAGSTVEGRSYFVMELVEGIPLGEFCDKNRLSVRKRLELFVPLCEAVQHAHQKGVVHRDLKPSNVLVTIQDGRPVPKVIDFGIAKAVGQDFMADSAVTEAGSTLGTPAYMSPEQAGAQGVDVDTRSDIYSLGVMLYELLVGELPVDPRSTGMPSFLSQLMGGALNPPSLSQKLDSMVQERAAEIAGLRSTDVRTLRQALEADLGWLVGMAIEQDRDRRYQTANAVALEIGRFLNEEPILARPPSWTYRLQKFIRRNRPAVAAVAVAFLAVLIGVIGITVGLFKATQAQEDALREAQKAREAEQTANDRLRNALVAQASALRRGEQVGRRYQSLELLSQAASIHPGRDLRDEAIASMALTDFRTVQLWQRPEEEISSLAFQPEDNRYAVGFFGGRVEIREIPTHRVQRTLSGLGPIPWIIRFNATGDLVAVKSHDWAEEDQAGLQLVDTRTGERLLSASEAVSGGSIDFDASNQYLAYGTREAELVLFDLRKQTEFRRLRLASAPSWLRFSPDGRRLAVAMRVARKVSIYDIPKGAWVQDLAYDLAYPFSVDWSPDGKRIVGGYSDAISWVWDLAIGERVLALRGHQAEVVQVSHHPSLPLVATHSWDGTSRIFNSVTGETEIVTTERVHDFSPDGKFLPFSTVESIGLWDVAGPDTFRTLYGHSGKSPRAVAVSPDGSWLVSAGEDGIILWGMPEAKAVAHLSPGAAEVLFEPSTDRFLACGSTGLYEWTIASSDTSAPLVAKTRLTSNPCTSVALDGAGSLLAVNERGRIWTRTRTETSPDQEFDGPESLSNLVISPDGKWMAAGNWRGEQTLVWDLKTTEKRSLLPGTANVSVSFSPDSRILLTGSSEDYRIWSVKNWGQASLLSHTKMSRLPGKMAFSEDGKQLALATDFQTIQVLDASSKAEIVNLRLTHPVALTALTFTADGSSLVAATSARQIHIWNLEEIFKQLQEYGLSEEAWAPSVTSPGSSLQTTPPLTLTARD